MALSMEARGMISGGSERYFVDTENARAFSGIYGRFTEIQSEFRDSMYRKKEAGNAGGSIRRNKYGWGTG